MLREAASFFYNNRGSPVRTRSGVWRVSMYSPPNLFGLTYKTSEDPRFYNVGLVRNAETDESWIWLTSSGFNGHVSLQGQYTNLAQFLNDIVSASQTLHRQILHGR